MTPEEIAESYEFETGKVIEETFKDKSPNDIPVVLNVISMWMDSQDMVVTLCFCFLLQN